MHIQVKCLCLSLLSLTYRSDLEHLRSVFMAVENGDIGMLKSLGIKDSELGDVKFFLEKLVNTGRLSMYYCKIHLFDSS